MIKIAPSLLAANYLKLGEEIERMAAAGADYLHFDVMDGSFVPNISFGMPVVKAVRPYAEIPFDVHLMISDPMKYAKEFAQAGADIITIHLETVEDPEAAIQEIRSLGKRVGIAISPDTPVETVLPHLGQVDMVLIMTVYPGFGGQSMISACLDKVRVVEKAARASHPNLIIQVDGGINGETAAAARDAGANCLVAGSAVFSAEDMTAAIGGLRG